MKKTLLTTTRSMVCIISVLLLTSMGLVAQEIHIEEIVVSAEFRNTALLETGNSISVIDSRTITRTRASHLSQLLHQAANVNYATGASRGRFIQIRGVGERSQFIEPLNPSVGILLNGIDLTGIGGAATTLDLQQVEILRGPQGTLFGANALAGMIKLVPNEPSEHLTGSLAATLGEDQLQTLSAVISGPASDTAAYRVAIQKHKSDGHINNAFLNRDDTNNLDELSMRALLRWQASSDLKVNLTTYFVDVDNGYDAFSLDNTRTTLSDEPGYDQQKSWAFGFETQWSAHPKFDLITQLSLVDSELAYAFDEDWSFPEICDGAACEGWAYTSFDSYDRTHNNTSIDLRAVSTQDISIFGLDNSWVLGIYLRNEEVQLIRNYTFAASDFTSDYDTKNYAVYGQLDSHLTDTVTISTGLRLERREADYTDNNAITHDNSEDLWGAHITLEYTAHNDILLYGKVARGYKAGGVNSNPALAATERNFDTENMWNIESGVKGQALQGIIQARLAVFYQFRKDMQVKQSLVEPITGEDCPCSFEDFLSNAARASNFGLELEFSWYASDSLNIYGSLGLLNAEFDNFESFSHVEADPENGVSIDLDGRKQAHAPSFQFAFGAEYKLWKQLSWTVDVEGKNKFKLSTRHEEQSKAYTLIHTALHYRTEHWDLSLWGRNLGNKRVIERGFGSFGNDPRNFYATEPYYQYGAPRVFGLSAAYNL